MKRSTGFLVLTALLLVALTITGCTGGGGGSKRTDKVVRIAQ